MIFGLKQKDILSTYLLYTVNQAEILVDNCEAKVFYNDIRMHLLK